MKIRITGVIVLLISLSVTVYAQQKTKNQIRYSAGLMTGYNRGFGLRADFTINEFPQPLPFDLRFGIGFSALNPGDAADARRIFINNATNGTPEKSGRAMDYRFDFMFSRTVFGVSDSYLVIGPRFSTFRGNFKYIGGNEEFDVISRQWGVGAGFENHFEMAQKLTLLIAYGLDFYIPSTLSGHDTSYSPDNDNVNPQNDNENDNIYFSYRKADKAIRQPFLMPHIMIGVNHSF